MFRELTRGIGDRTVIKRLRPSSYPQKGLTKTIDAQPQNTRVRNGNIVSVKSSGANPFLINTINFSIPNMFKGEVSGISFVGATVGVNTLNPIFFSGIPPASSYFPTRQNAFFGDKKNNLSIASFYAMSSTPLEIFPHLLYICANDLFVERNSSLTLTPQKQFYNAIDLRSSIAFHRPRNESDAMDRMQYLKGFIKSGTLQIKNNSIRERSSHGQQVKFNMFTLTENIQGDTTRFNLLGQGMSLLGYLDYREPNSITSQNASWLLNQRTQYQRKFNPLKNLGV